MNIKVELDGELLGTVSISKEGHDCMLSQLRKVQKTELEHAVDADTGVLLFVDADGEVTVEPESNEPLMDHVGQVNADGTPIMLDDLTVFEWFEQCVKGKINNCMKRAHMADFTGI